MLQDFLLQGLDDSIVKLKNKYYKKFSKASGEINIFKNFNYFLNSAKPKYALVSYLPAELNIALKASVIKRFNQTGAALEISKALNELGYIVDMIDYRITDYKFENQYDLYIGQSCSNFEIICNLLSKDTKKVTYATTSYWRYFNSESLIRYDNFKKRKNIIEEISYARPIDDEEYCVTKSDLITCFGKYCAESFPKGSKVIPIRNASYFEKSCDLSDKNFKDGRNKFIFFAGTGNIQKGLDLLIEAFSQLPSLHLFIFAPLEKDILKYYRKELQLKNIHYIYHLRKFPKKLKEIINTSNFTLYAGFNSGTPTALIGSLSDGLIPVVNKDSNLEIQEEEVLIPPSPSIDDLMNVILRASKMPISWYKETAVKSQEYFLSNHTIGSFNNLFKEALRSL